MATTGCKCDPCSVMRTKCGTCLPCVPRYMCLIGTYTPSAYTEEDGNCPTAFCTRMFWDCGSNQWVMLDIPRHFPEPSVGITMGIVEDDYPETCRYSVYAFGETILFEIDEAIVFSHTDESGNTYDIEISGAGMVANPLSRAQCGSPCRCATCLPSELCMYLETTACEGIGSGKATWNGYGWEGSIGDWDVTISLKPCVEGCGATINMTGPGGSAGPCDIFFEGPVGPVGECAPPYTEYRCTEGDDDAGEVVTRLKGGTPGGCIFEERVLTYFTNSCVVRSGSGGSGPIIGTLTVTDNPCGCPCDTPTAQNCFGACPVLESNGLSCPPPVLYAELFSPSCSVAFTMGDPDFHIAAYVPNPLLPSYSYCQRAASFRTVGGVTTGPTVVFYQSDADQIFDGQFILYHEGQSCDDNGKSRPSDYKLLYLINFWCCNSMPGPCYIIGTVTPSEASCDPFTLEFDLGITWGTIADGSGGCYPAAGPCGGVDEGLRLRITL